jgi:BRCT domain type II-containing protein
VCNEDAGSTKSQKAKKFGVKVLTEQEFLAMLGDVKPEKVEEKPQPKTYSLFEKTE